MNRLNKKRTFIEISDDVKLFNKELQGAAVDSIRGFSDGVQSIYHTFADLPDQLNEAKNGFEAFFEVINAGFSIFDQITSFIDSIHKIVELTNLLTGAKKAQDAVQKQNITNMQNEQTQQMVSIGLTATEAVADEVAADAAGHKAAMNVAESSTEASKQNSKLGPFGWIAGIAAAVAVAGALLAILSQTKGYATGGVVGGSTTMGDKILIRANRNEMILNTRQ